MENETSKYKPLSEEELRIMALEKKVLLTREEAIELFRAILKKGLK